MLLQLLSPLENPHARSLRGHPVEVGFSVVQRGKEVLNPQFLARFLKDIRVGLMEVFGASYSSDQWAFVFSAFLHVFFITAHLDHQGNTSSLWRAGVLRVCHDLSHHLLLFDF